MTDSTEQVGEKALGHPLERTLGHPTPPPKEAQHGSSSDHFSPIETLS